eukprot:evm.model.scf_1839.3 EVM.evm.TU.scf_1839.3   scf_1839:10638-19103(+)
MNRIAHCASRARGMGHWGADGCGSGRVLGVWWALQALLLAAVLLAPAECGDAEEGGARAPMIVVVKDGDSLRKLREMCQLGTPGDKAGPGFFAGVTKHCILTAGPCRHVFTSSIKGVSGDFTPAELQIIEECMRGGIKYIEADGEVNKKEDLVFGTYDRPEPTPEDLVQMRRQILQDGAMREGRNVLAFGDPKDFLGQEVDEASLSETVNSWGTKVQHVHTALWNLDRVDQRELPLDGEYRYGADNVVGTGKGVSVFLLDSGIRSSHEEFRNWGEGGARAYYGWDFVDDDDESEDCDGHGTHVASTAVGRMVGIAKQADVVAVRVLDCQGTGNISTTIAGLDWVAQHGRRPGVVGLSLGVTIGKWSRTLEDTVRALINDHGFSVVVASGNSAVDSCYVAPANVAETITVAGHNLENKFEHTSQGDVEGIYRWSNTGPCIDLFAPAVDIFGACGGKGRCREVTDDAYTWASGTSMAVPHVAGVAAVYLGEHPDASPAEVKDAIIAHTTREKIGSDLMKPNTPNRLLYSRVFEQTWV